MPYLGNESGTFKPTCKARAIQCIGLHRGSGPPTMTMTPSLRKFALTAHVTSSVGLLGSIAAFLALAVAGLTSEGAQVVRAAYLAMDLTTRFVIVPLAFASLLRKV